MTLLYYRHQLVVQEVDYNIFYLKNNFDLNLFCLQESYATYQIEIIHLWGLLFQSIIVEAGGFLSWLWLLSIYPASGVASFSFLTPIFTIFFGWLILGESLTINFLFAAFLVIFGLILINRQI